MIEKKTTERSQNEPVETEIQEECNREGERRGMHIDKEKKRGKKPMQYQEFRRKNHTHTLKEKGRDGTKQKTSGANSLVI